MDKTKGGVEAGEERGNGWGWGRKWGGVGKCRQLYLNNNKIIFLNKRPSVFSLDPHFEYYSPFWGEIMFCLCGNELK